MIHARRTGEEAAAGVNEDGPVTDESRGGR